MEFLLILGLMASLPILYTASNSVRVVISFKNTPRECFLHDADQNHILSYVNILKDHCILQCSQDELDGLTQRLNSWGNPGDLMFRKLISDTLKRVPISPKKAKVKTDFVVGKGSHSTFFELANSEKFWKQIEIRQQQPQREDDRENVFERIIFPILGTCKKITILDKWLGSNLFSSDDFYLIQKAIEQNIQIELITSEITREKLSEITSTSIHNKLTSQLNLAPASQSESRVTLKISKDEKNFPHDRHARFNFTQSSDVALALGYGARIFANRTIGQSYSIAPIPPESARKREFDALRGTPFRAEEFFLALR